MSYHSQLRLSWYFPLTELLLNKNLVKQEHQWLIKPGTTRISEFDNFSSEIKHFESIGFGNRFGYPLLIKDRRIRIVYDIDFPPLYYATTRQKKISFQINSSSTSNILTNEDLRIRTLRAQLKLYPVGFGSIALFFTFDEIINSKILTNIEKNWTYGKKKLSINAFSQYLKVLIIHSLFKQEAINDIQLQLNGPKVRASIIGPDYSVKDFQIFTKDILSPNKKTSSISYHFNEEKKDQIAFHKTGITQFQSIELSTGTRRYCRNNLDYILDLIYGSEILFTLLPKKFTQYDLRKRTNKDFLRAIHAPFFTLNPYVLTNENENQNTLPSAALRIWFKKLLNAVNLKKKYNNFLETMMIKFREFRIDRWYQILMKYLIENVPFISKLMIKEIRSEDIKLREIVHPLPNLDKLNVKIIEFLLEKTSKDLVNRFGLGSTTAIDETSIGWCTVHQIEREFNITGRDHFEFKNRLELLNKAGLLESKPYKGPGASKKSKQYRICLTHPYVDKKLRVLLTKESVSGLKLSLLS